jgi:hypothetical protein
LMLDFNFPSSTSFFTTSVWSTADNQHREAVL